MQSVIYNLLFLTMKILRLFFVFVLMIGTTYSQVGINTTSPSSASILDVESSSDGVNFGGFMPPRVSLTERNSIPVTAADDGMMVFLIEGNTREVQIWNGVDLQWETVYAMPVNQAPVANNVTFSGSLVVGETLTASFSYSDAEGDLAGTHTYNWYQADDGAGTNQLLLQTGTSNTFLLTNSELNKYIAVEVTPAAITGTSPGTAVLSTYQGPVTNNPIASDLFISEYVEGSGLNKVIEVANFTGASVNLSNYEINVYVNGGSSPSATYSFPNVNLATGNVYVIKHASASSPCDSPFDDTFGWSFNGNDVVELVTSSGTRIDILGTIGSSSDFAKNITLRKKATIGPNTTYTSSDYDSYSIDTCSGLGSHTF